MAVADFIAEFTYAEVQYNPSLPAEHTSLEERLTQNHIKIVANQPESSVVQESIQ